MIAQLTQLKQLNLAGTSVTQVGPTLAKSNIELLGLSHTVQVDGKSPLPGLAKWVNDSKDGPQRLDRQTAANLITDAYVNNRSTLNLSNLSIGDELPELAIAQLTQLTQLNLRNSSVKSLGQPLAALKNLELLILTGTKISKIDDVVYDMTNLTTLGFGRTDVKEVSEKISNLKKLVNIGAYDSKLEKWPEVSLVNLQDFDIEKTPLAQQANNALKGLDQWVASGSSLEQQKARKIVSNRITTAHLSKNQVLDLSGLPLGEDLPEQAIAQLTHLKELDLSGSSVKRLGNDLAALKNLTVLDLSKTKIEKIDDVVYEMSSLKKLKFSHNKQITELSEKLGQLNKLEELDAYNTSLKKLPKVALPALKILNVGKTPIRHLPNTLSQSKNLEAISLEGATSYKKLSRPLATLRNLKSLDLSYSGINDLQIRMTPNSTRLRNKLTAAATNPALFTELQKRLKNFPNALSKLHELQALYNQPSLANNPIQKAHASVARSRKIGEVIEATYIPYTPSRFLFDKKANLLQKNVPYHGTPFYDNMVVPQKKAACSMQQPPLSTQQANNCQELEAYTKSAAYIQRQAQRVKTQA